MTPEEELDLEFLKCLWEGDSIPYAEFLKISGLTKYQFDHLLGSYCYERSLVDRISSDSRDVNFEFCIFNLSPRGYQYYQRLIDEEKAEWWRSLRDNATFWIVLVGTIFTIYLTCKSK